MKNIFSRIQTYHLPAILILCILTGIVYSNTLNAPFIFDDNGHIKNNPAIRVTKLSVPELFKAGFKSPQPRRPLANISFAANYYFGEYEVIGYHLVNISIHMINSILFYFLSLVTLKRISQKSVPPEFRTSEIRMISLLSALIFAAHPVQTQSVTYIVQRVTSLATLFYLVSFLLYIEGRLLQEQRTDRTAGGSESASRFPRQSPYLWFTGSGLAWLMAMCSKQTAVSLPFFLYLYEWYFFQNLSREWFKRSLKVIAGIFVAVGLISLVYLGPEPLQKITSINDYQNSEFTYAERVLTQPRVVIYYLSLIFYPHPSRLNLDYDYSLSRSLLTPATTLLSIGAIVALLAVAFILRRKERLFSFCIFWFFGNLALESSVIPIAVIFEHRVYLPSMFVILLAVALIYRYVRLAALKIIIFVTLIGILSVWTYERNSVWRNEVTIWQDCVSKSPNKARPHNNLGSVLKEKGRLEDAIEHFYEALALKPDYAEAHCNLGIALAEQNNEENAIDHFRKALVIDPDYTEAHSNLGVALNEVGNTEEAVVHLSEALRIDPSHPVAHYNLGSILNQQGNFKEAVRHFNAALTVRPDYAKAHNGMGLALNRLGRSEEAAFHFSKALRSSPDLVEARRNMGDILLQQGKAAEAVEHYTEVLRLRPDQAGVHHLLGAALAVDRRYDEAVVQFNKVLNIDPSNAEAHFNIGNIRKKQGRLEEAIRHYLDAVRIDPAKSEAYVNMGSIYLAQGDYDSATRQLSKAVSIEPDHARAHNMLGIIYFKTGKIDEAIRYFSTTVSIEPGNASAHNNLGSALASKGRYKQAIVHYQKALTIMPDYEEARINLEKAKSELNTQNPQHELRNPKQ